MRLPIHSPPAQRKRCPVRGGGELSEQRILYATAKPANSLTPHAPERLGAARIRAVIGASVAGCSWACECDKP